MIPHARIGNVSWKVGFLFALGGASGAVAGGMATRYLPGNLLIAGFVAMMLAAGVAMIRGRKEVKGPVPRPSVPRILAAGLGSGLLTGLVGAGGGFIVVPALTLFEGLDMRRAVGTSLMVITINTFAGYIGHATHSNLDYRVAAAITVAAVLGSVLGGVLSQRVSQTTLKKGFGSFVIAMAMYMCFQQLYVGVLHGFGHTLVGPCGRAPHRTGQFPDAADERADHRNQRDRW